MMTLETVPIPKSLESPPIAARPVRWPVFAAALLALALVVTANVVGHRLSRTYASQCRHGWPWEYFARWRATPLFSGVAERISLWPAAEDVNEFHPWRLAGNVAVGLLVVALAAVAVEVARRGWPRMGPRVRPRFRSTWWVFALVLLACGLANFPGSREVGIDPVACAHGWPWSWLYREAVTPATHYTVSIWTPHRDVLRLSVPRLVVNVSACLLLAALVAAVSERRRSGLRSVWQFTLKDALGATTLAAVALSWPSMRDFWNRDEIESVRRLRAARTAVGVEPRRPDWFWELRGVDLVQTMNADLRNARSYSHRRDLRLTAVEGALLEELDLWTIELNDATLDDGSVSFLRHMTKLRLAAFSNAALTDAGLATLRAARELKYLAVDGCPISDAGMRSVAQMTELWELDLTGTPVTDAGLAHLRGMPELQRINLSATAVTDAGMAHLTALKNLESAYLHQTAIGDEGVAILVTLPKLRRLEMGDTRVTDAGLKHLHQAKYLATLNLAGTAITDRGLEELARLERLELLYLTNCPHCTEAGIRRLRQARPTLLVQWSPSPTE